MWPITAQVADQMIPRLAKYFSEQAPARALGEGPLAAEGTLIYQRGAQGIPACQNCHGASGEGSGAIPRLAGQHAGYLKAQLSAINLMVRVSDTMHPNVKSMTERQMDAVTAYLGNH